MVARPLSDFDSDSRTRRSPPLRSEVVNRHEALTLVMAICAEAGWEAGPIPGQKAVRATRSGRAIELRVSVLGPNSRGQWLKRTMPIGSDMYACPIIDGEVYLIPSEEWRQPGDVLGSAEYPSRPSEPEWTMTRSAQRLPAFLAEHRAHDVLARLSTGPMTSEPAIEGTPLAVQVIEIEASTVEASVRQTTAVTSEAVRREAQLVHAYADFVRNTGNVAQRLRITTSDGETLYTDIWIPGRALLVEAKATADRASIRMALGLGQLIDYSRAVDGVCTRAVLIPEKPTDDLIALIHAGEPSRSGGPTAHSPIRCDPRPRALVSGPMPRVRAVRERYPSPTSPCGEPMPGTGLPRIRLSRLAPAPQRNALRSTRGFLIPAARLGAAAQAMHAKGNGLWGRLAPPVVSLGADCTSVARTRD